METSQRPPGRNIDQRPHASPSFQMLAQTWKGFLQMRQVSTQGPKGPRSRQSALCHLLVFLLLSPPSDRTCRASEPPTQCHPRRFCCPHRHRRKRIYFHLRDQLPRRRPEGDWRPNGSPRKSEEYMEKEKARAGRDARHLRGLLVLHPCPLDPFWLGKRGVRV